MKKGAMFGLDARIALAIFGALSVISGAALYSAIQSANAEKWNQLFSEMVKAYEAYYLDTGQTISVHDSSWLRMSADELVLNSESVTGWKGPYITDTNFAMSGFIRNSLTDSIHSNTLLRFNLRKGSTWTEMDDITTDGHCVINDYDCYSWVVLQANDAGGTPGVLNLFNILDEKIDGGDGELAGKIRYNTYSSDYLYYKGIPTVYRG